MAVDDVPGHPCVCGERVNARVASEWVLGSSLRVRGAVEASDSAQDTLRVIPACAGNGCTLGPTCVSWAGHPCVCGERRDETEVTIVVNGSSLRVRGAAEVAAAKPA